MVRYGIRLNSTMTPGQVHGPYLDKGRGRMIVTIIRPDGSKGSMTYARWLYQEHVQRVLDPEEHVDHIDEDKLNDQIGNFQLLSNLENHRKSRGEPEMVTFLCPTCGVEATKLARMVRHNRKLGRAGPFCGKLCAGKYRAPVAQSRQRRQVEGLIT